MVVAIALFFFEAFVPPLWFGDSELKLFSSDVLAYMVAGLVLGFIWPNMSWRLGLWLFSVWPPIILLMFLFSDPPPIIPWKKELLSLLGYLMILPGACLGAWIGSILRRRFSSDTSHDNQHMLPTS